MQQYKSSYLSFVFLLLLSFSGFSQKIKLLNQASRTSIGEVFVYNTNQTSNAVSDTNGVIDISAFNKKDTLIFTHPAYKIFSIPYINIGNIIYLKENPIALKPVEITAQQVRQEALAITAKSIKLKQKLLL